MSTAPAIARIDIMSAAFKADPFPYYAELRANAPVYPVTAFRGQRAWLVTRYDDVLALLKDDTFTKEAASAMTAEQYRKSPKIPGPFKVLSRNLLALDGPEHDRLRVLVHKAFTPRLVERMREQTRILAHGLLDRATAQGGTFNLIADFALPLPLAIIARILGIPERDHEKFRRWTASVLAIGNRGNPLLKVPAILQFVRYLRKLIRLRAAEPQDDLISALAQAQERDDRLAEDEILAMIFLLFTAGHETTVNLIASGTLALLEQRDQWERLRADPALIRPGIEELLRYASPAETATERYARQDVTVAGTTIPRGELVLGVLASANRDAARFADPDSVDVAREDNRHLAFGQGGHYCVGAPLARLEGQVAIGALLERLPGLRLAVPPADLRWRSSFIVRGLEALPVRA